MINKSNPEDMVVEPPRILKPPRPNIKQPKPQNYYSVDLTSNRKMTKNSPGKNSLDGKSLQLINFETKSDNDEKSKVDNPDIDNDNNKSVSKNIVTFESKNEPKKNIHLSFRSDKSENLNFKEVEDFKNSDLFKKMAKKIRYQAKRIMEIEEKLVILEKRKIDDIADKCREANQNIGSGKLIHVSLQGEISLTKKKNELLIEENDVLKQKIQILEKSIKKAKSTIIDSFSRNEDTPGINVVEVISNLETENIELQEVLKQECIKNEKLESMVELLRKLYEEKLKSAGFEPFGEMSRVETVLDVSKIYQNNIELAEDLENLKNSELVELKKKVKNLKSCILSLEKKNQILVEFKMKCDKNVLEVKKKQIDFEKLVSFFCNLKGRTYER